MSKVKFKKEELQGLVGFEEPEGFEIVEDKILETTRWSVINNLIFKFENKFYQVTYSHGSTEYQDESPFEYEGDEIECDEVVPVEATVIKYERIDNR